MTYLYTEHFSSTSTVGLCTQIFHSCSLQSDHMSLNQFQTEISEKLCLIQQVGTTAQLNKSIPGKHSSSYASEQINLRCAIFFSPKFTKTVRFPQFGKYFTFLFPETRAVIGMFVQVRDLICATTLLLCSESRRQYTTVLLLDLSSTCSAVRAKGLVVY